MTAAGAPVLDREALDALAARAVREGSLQVGLLLPARGACGAWSSDELVCGARVRCDLVVTQARGGPIALVQARVDGAPARPTPHVVHRLRRAVAWALRRLVVASVSPT